MQELHVHKESIHDVDPTIYKEALCDKDSSRWIEAMRTEMDSMYVNQVWTLVDTPEGIVQLGANGSSRERLVQMER